MVVRKTTKVLLGILGIFIAWLVFEFTRDPESGRKSFLDGFRATSGSTAP